MDFIWQNQDQWNIHSAKAEARVNDGVKGPQCSSRAFLAAQQEACCTLLATPVLRLAALKGLAAVIASSATAGTTSPLWRQP